MKRSVFVLFLIFLFSCSQDKIVPLYTLYEVEGKLYQKNKKTPYTGYVDPLPLGHSEDRTGKGYVHLGHRAGTWEVYKDYVLTLSTIYINGKIREKRTYNEELFDEYGGYKLLFWTKYWDNGEFKERHSFSPTTGEQDGLIQKNKEGEFDGINWNLGERDTRITAIFNNGKYIYGETSKNGKIISSYP
ncbi:MAG: hypothetical protein CMG75_08885 [Candidatus Marinimicrobia bacterium]|nr:hypothetical protein [Candidatus Neomarinimicrobiota bacterium]|tara:strand:- start:6822 stop:7385 length:564 start_codon:yes stop_codon:yes gene_type:complete